MSTEELEKKAIEAIRHVQIIARNPGNDNFRDFGKPSDVISTIRKSMFRKPIRNSASVIKRKYVKKSKSELSQRMEEESSGDSYTTKRHKPSPKSRHVSHPVKKVKEEKKTPEVSIPGGYCSDCYLSIQLPKEPWKEMKPCKPAQIRNRGKHLGQAQYQMESYLSCVSSIYNNRSAIPDGLHDTQLYLFNRAKMLGRLCSDLAPTNPLENWTPREIAIFEAAISVYGKEFYKISKCIKSKTTQEVIEFYYTWKFSSHYYAWKTHYRSPYEDCVVRGG